MEWLATLGVSVPKEQRWRGAVSWHPTSNLLAVNHPANHVSLYPITEDRTRIETQPNAIIPVGRTTAIRWLPDGWTLALYDLPHWKMKTPTIRVWNIRTNEMKVIWDANDRLVGWNADFTVQVTGEGDRLQLNGQAVQTSMPYLQHIQVSADGSTAVVIVAQQPDQSTHAYYADTRKSYHFYPPPNFKVEVWDIAHGQQRFQMDSSLDYWRELTVSPDGNYYVLDSGYWSSGDGDMRTDFRINSCTSIEDLVRHWSMTHDTPILPVWATDSKQVIYWEWLMSLSNPRSHAYIKHFEIATQKATRYENEHLEGIRPHDLAWSADREWLAIANEDGTVQVYRMKWEA